MPIRIGEFEGLAKLTSPRLLQEKFAVQAINCRVESGALAPIRGLLESKTLPISPTSIYRYQDDNWFTFTQDVDVVRAPVAYDATNRVVYTGVLFPRQTRNDIALSVGTMPNSYYRLGIPAPSTAMNVASLGAVPPGAGEEGSELLQTTVFYVYCYVSAWGEEGPPSPVSGGVDIYDGQTATLQFGAAPGGQYNFAAGALRRIYRSNSGSTDTAFQFLADISIAATEYIDGVPADSLGEVIPSIKWQGPPDDNALEFPSGQLKGIRALASGALVGFSGNTLVYSEPYLPHAWANFYPLKDEIVAIEVTSSGVLVATTDRPVIALGLDPQAISIQEVDVRLACVNKRSMVDMGEYAIYASPDGLVGMEANGSAQLLTKSLMNREQWSFYGGETLSAYRWEDKYVAFWPGGGGFIFSPNDSAGTFIQLSPDFVVSAGFYNAPDDTLYVAVGNKLMRFDYGPVLPYYWLSKIFQETQPVSYSVMQVIADNYPVNVKVIRGGDMISAEDDYVITSDKPVRMPPGRSHTWQFEITGTATVHSLAVGQSMDEIARG